jgi:hypothetical protein
MNDATSILREFVADVLSAHDNNFNRAMEALETEWLDLAVTFQKAYVFLERLD